MKLLLVTIVASSLGGFAVGAPPTKPVPVITPGKVIIPFDKMRRIWGELISLDPATRTGKFRNESNDEVMSFTVMPYAELLHHATLGDLQDFKVGERAIFRLHVNEKEEWVWLTYIQDEMNMMNGHKEYFHVDAIDAVSGTLTCKWANADFSFVREPVITLETDKDTHYWKNGQPAKFSEIKIGDKLRTQTHGTGSGKHRVPWEVFLDEESLATFQAKQKAVHEARMMEKGAPAYVDESNGAKLRLTIFNEADEYVKALKQGAQVRIAAAGVDRNSTMAPMNAKVAAMGKSGRQTTVTLDLDGAATAFRPAGLARMWLVSP